MGELPIFSFEDIDERLQLLPYAARRALDVVGLKLSLDGWRSLPLARRQSIVRAGGGEWVDTAAVRAAVEAAEPPPEPRAADDEQRLVVIGEVLADALAALPGARRLVPEQWAELGALARYCLLQVASRGKAGRLEQAYDEICGAAGLAGITHLDARGEAHMVDVGDKPITRRRAIAAAAVCMRPDTARRIVEASTTKGDVLAVARVAAISAAKRTPDLIPLCHTIALTRVEVSFDVDVAAGRVAVKAAADAYDRTGVEMEAMVAASVAALTIYDMLKGVERGMRIEGVVLLAKQGGRSGHYRRDPHEEPAS